MASSASDLLKLELQSTGDNPSTWGTKANTTFSRLEEAVAGFTNITLASANYTLNDTPYAEHDDGANTSESHVAMIKATGTLGANVVIIIPARTKHYMVWNATSGAFAVTIGDGSGTATTIPQGFIQHVFFDGTNCEAASPPFNVTGQQHYPKGGDIASASPLVIDTDGDMFDVTGTTGFSAMTVAIGRLFVLQFDGALTMTHGAGTLDLPGGANITTAAGDIATCYSTAANKVRVLSYARAGGYVLGDIAASAKTEVLGVAASDETTALTTGTAKVSFHMPYAFKLTDVQAGCTTAPTGATLTVDINEAGSTILSTKITIDIGEKTSQTAATPPVISDTTLAAGALITIDIDQIGSTVAGAGLKVYLIGYQT